MTTRYIILAYWHDDAVHDNVMFSIEIMSTFKAIKSHLKPSYDKQNLTLMVISYEILRNWPKTCLKNIILNDHLRKILYVSHFYNFTFNTAVSI